MSQPPRSNRGQRERNGGGNRENRHNDRPPPSDRSSRPPYYPDERSQPRPARSAPRKQKTESKCTHICSRRGIVLICAVLTNVLVLICIVSAYITMSGMSRMSSFAGGSFIGANIPFEGTELQQVRDLDMQYGQMRAPGVYGGVAFSLVMGVVSLLFVVSGNKPAHRLPRKLLVCQFIFQLVGGVAYVVAVGLYLHFVIKVNSTEVCQMRERLYARNGQSWMNCDVSGADAAVALFGLLTAILYAAGTILTFQTIRYVQQYHKDRKHYEAERQSRPRATQNAPLQPDAYV
ncbi:MARVEL domain-containing protein 3 [Chanos chanos]|uniref:MARVEL domain-containing protein 3 n=1 Tax=Chanos chanos TaxID=29144 RepID=A0A6J2V104_CHACN|nr:MARVEL domain-containing protein 3-like [Chanos chanos]